MKQVYVATIYGRSKVKVFASDENEAKRAAFAAHTYNGAMWHPNPAIDDVVTKVELDPDQVMNGQVMQPAVQLDDYNAPTVREILAEQFQKKAEDTGRENT